MSLTPGKAHCPGSTQGSLAGTPTRLFQASTSPGSWQRPEVGTPGGGGGVGADSLWVMEKLEHRSWWACSIRVWMSTIEGEFVTVCQRCWTSSSRPGARAWTTPGIFLLSLFYPCCQQDPNPLPQTPPSAIPPLAAPSRPEAYLALVPSGALSLLSVLLSRPSPGLCLPTLLAPGAQICSSSTQ